MSELETAVQRFRAHDGVEQVLLIGRDGLLIHQSGASDADTETVAALAPGLTADCSAMAAAAGRGRCRTVVMEWERGVGILAAVADDLLLLVLVRQGVGFASLLRSVREQQSTLAMLAE
jgi:predicted regulator of Ras-like GTPase activity (Roadblock/LC7/MglB family)